MRKQRAMTSLLAGLLALGLAIPVHAETFYGDENWNVAFTPEKEKIGRASCRERVCLYG